MAPEQCSIYPFSDTSLNYVRRVVRLIRPAITLSTASLWDAGEGSLLDAAPVCPPNSAARASLVWNDGMPSGYSIDPLPAAASTMSLPIGISP